MFSVENNITDRAIRKMNHFKVLFSMNVHQVANPEMSLEDARSYVFFSREGGGKNSVYVGLHFLLSGRKFFYAHSANSFPEAQLADIEEDARRFAEDLGAMLDEVDFSKMSDSEKDSWIGNLEILSDKKKEEKVRQEPAPAEAAGPAAPAESASPPVVEVQPDSVQPAPVQAAAVPSGPSAVSAAPADASAAPKKQQQSPVSAAPITPQTSSPVQALPVKPAAKTPSQRLANASSAAATEECLPVQTADRVPEEAVKDGVAKAPKAQLKKDARSATGLIGREKEALARLLASF